MFFKKNFSLLSSLCIASCLTLSPEAFGEDDFGGLGDSEFLFDMFGNDSEVSVAADTHVTSFVNLLLDTLKEQGTGIISTSHICMFLEPDAKDNFVNGNTVPTSQVFRIKHKCPLTEKGYTPTSADTKSYIKVVRTHNYPGAENAVATWGRPLNTDYEPSAIVTLRLFLPLVTINSPDNPSEQITLVGTVEEYKEEAPEVVDAGVFRFDMRCTISAPRHLDQSTNFVAPATFSIDNITSKQLPAGVIFFSGNGALGTSRSACSIQVYGVEDTEAAIKHPQIAAQAENLLRCLSSLSLFV